MTVDFKVVIPARYDSSRLPGKPLRLIQGKPMICWVIEAAQASAATEVLVATDDERIIDAVNGYKVTACLTSIDHQTGSDRIVEAAELQGWSDDTIIVNLQGDEPLMPAVNLTQVANNLQQSGFEMATLYKLIDQDQAVDPNQVKLVRDKSGRALYFSRSNIPFQRNLNNSAVFGHIGLYAYRVGFLKQFAKYQPCELEKIEGLEQLRALYYGCNIHTDLAVATPGRGVDTLDDLIAVSEQLARSLSDLG